jgi:hypothetical protein
MITQRFYHRYKDILEKEYLLEIYIVDYVEYYSYEIINSDGENPVSYSYAGMSKNEWDSVYIQGMSLQFKCVFPIDMADEVEGLISSSYKQWRVKYSTGGNTLFLGFLKPENMTKRFEKQPSYFEIEITASDGLAELKEINFYQPYEEPQTGALLLLQSIKFALTPIQLELPFKIQVNTYEAIFQNTVSPTCVFMKALTRVNKFYNFNESEDKTKITSKKCWDVLEMMLKSFNAKLFQYNGFYCIVNHLELASFEYLYSWELTLTSRTAIDPVIDLSDYLYIPYVEQQKIHPLKSILTIITGEGSSSSVDDYGGTDFTDWLNVWMFSDDSGARWQYHTQQPSGNLLCVVVNTNQPWMRLLSDISITKKTDNREYIRFSGKFRLTLWDSYVGLFTHGKLEDLDIKIRMGRSGIWGEYRSLGTPQVISDTNEAWIGFNTQADSLFEIRGDGTYNVEFLIDSLKGSKHFDSLTIELADFKVEQITGIANISNPIEFNISQSYFQINTDGYEDIDLELSFLDRSSVYDSSAFFFADGGSYTPSSSWRTWGRTEDIKIVDLSSRLILLNRSAYKNFLHGTVLDRDVTFDFRNIIKIQDKYYAIASYERNFKYEHIEFDLVELITGSLAGYDEIEDVTNKSDSIPIVQGITEKSADINIAFQDNHDFQVGDVIRCEVINNEVVYYLALADVLEHSYSIGVVSEVIDDHEFQYISEGFLPPEVFSNYVPGTYYFLSSTVLGGMVTVDNLIPGQIEQCIGFGTSKGFKVEIDAKNISNSPDAYDWIDGTFEDIVAGIAKDYVLDLKALVGYIIDSAVFQVDAGTLTVAIKIGTTAVTGLSAVAVDTDIDETAATAANTVAAGNKVILAVSTTYTGAPTLIHFKLNLTRT